MIYDIYICIHKYIDGWMDGWIDDWARAQGAGARGPIPGSGPGARDPNRALGPCALGTWARARAQSSILVTGGLLKDNQLQKGGNI